MIEIFTDWTFGNTKILLDGAKLNHVFAFKIKMDIDGPILEITKYRDKDGQIYVEKAGTDGAFVPFETLTFSEFKIFNSLL